MMGLADCDWHISSLHRTDIEQHAPGTNLQALMDAAGSDRLPNAQITYVENRDSMHLKRMGRLSKANWRSLRLYENAESRVDEKQESQAEDEADGPRPHIVAGYLKHSREVTCDFGPLKQESQAEDEDEVGGC
jgi:hypothetical protein